MTYATKRRLDIRITEEERDLPMMKNQFVQFSIEQHSNVRQCFLFSRILFQEAFSFLILSSQRCDFQFSNVDEHR